MNRAYIGKIMELADKDKKVCHLVADSGTGLDEAFKMNFPKQMYNFGIAENNMIGVAAGMAMCGEIPFVFTADAFLVYRSFEFIRDDICLQNLNVKIIGMGNGVSWSSLGPTHHTTEAIGVLRTLPNLVILNPATPKQVSECVEYAYKYNGPVYIRIGMNNEKEFYDDNYKFDINEDGIIYENNKQKDKTITLFSTGSILEEAYETKVLFENDGYGMNIINVTALKPFNEDVIMKFADVSKVFVSIEEHNIIGGFGSIIADALVKNEKSVRLIKIGLNNKFADGFGTIKNVRLSNGFDSNSIYRKVKELI